MLDEMPKIKLKAVRVNAGLDQKKAANLLGISVSTLQSYESGNTYPDIVVVQKMEKVYHFPWTHIIFDKNNG